MDFQTMILQIMTYFNSDPRWPFEVRNISNPANPNMLQLECVWNWKNAIVASTQGISDEQRMFKSVYTIYPNGVYAVQDISQSSSKGFFGGKFGIGKSAFKGKQIGMHKEIAIGKNKQNGQVGVIGFDFNTEKIHQPMDTVLQSYGLKKQGF